MEFTIRGEVLQVVNIQLQAGESIFTERGGMGWMTPNVDMQTNARGGIGKSIGRMFSGESFFMTTYTASEGTALVSFCNEFPGKIIPLDLSEGETMVCQKDAFMVAQSSVKLETKFSKRFGAGLFGGEGFILQQITGPGKAFVEIAGEVTEYELQEGQVLKVDPGHIAMMTSSIDYDIARVKGIKNVLFGGEGLFLATVKGPGKVWLQSMPVAALAMKLIPYLPKKS